MNVTDVAPVSVIGYGEQAIEITEAIGYISSVKEYYAQLKAPYLSSQHLIRQKIQAENEKFRLCQNEILLNSHDKNKVAMLKVRAENHQFALSDMESGLNWAAGKIRELDMEMENRIRMAEGWKGSANIFGVQSVTAIAALA